MYLMIHRPKYIGVPLTSKQSFFSLKFSLHGALTDHCMIIQFQRTKNFFISKAQIKLQRYCCVYVHLQTTTRCDKDIIWRPPYNFIWRSPYNFIWRPPYNFIWRPPYNFMWRPPNNQFMWRPPYKFMWRPPYKFIWRPPYNLLKWRPPYKFMWRPPYKLYGGRHLMTLYGGRQIKLYGGRHIICTSNYYRMWHQSASVDIILACIMEHKKTLSREILLITINTSI